MQDPMFYVIAGIVIVILFEIMGARKPKTKAPEKKNSSANPNHRKQQRGPRDWEPVDPRKVTFK